MYHLKGLLREGLVEKAETDYRLSVKGVQFAGTLSLKTGKTRTQPKILNTVICKNDAGEYLLVRWHRQPNIGQISFPHGMMHYGHSAYDMAALELAEKAGLEADLTYRGDVYVRGMRGEVVDRHMLVHVFEAANLRPGRQSEIRPDVCEPFWAQLDSLDPKTFVPGFYEIAQIAAQPHTAPLFRELTVTVPDFIVS